MTRVFQSLFGVVAAASFSAAGLVLIIDFYTPLGITVSALHVIPILISLLADNRRLTLVVAAVCSVLVAIGYWFSPTAGVALWIVHTDRVIVLLLLWGTAILGMEVTKAKDQIRQLGRILTMCAWTRQIKVNEEWISIEEYLRKHVGLQVTHGISREAAEKLMGDQGIEIR